MKYKDLPIIALGLFIMGGSILNLITAITWYGVGLGVVGLYTITYVILAIKREIRLESELHYKESIRKQLQISHNTIQLKYEELEHNLANQVKATDEAEKERDNGMAIDYTDKNLEDKMYIDGIDFERGTILNVMMKELYNVVAHRKAKDNIIPFSEEMLDRTHQLFDCPKCGELMGRRTEKISFCDNIECDRKQWNIDKLKGVE